MVLRLTGREVQKSALRGYAVVVAAFGAGG